MSLFKKEEVEMRFCLAWKNTCYILMKGNLPQCGRKEWSKTDYLLSSLQMALCSYWNGCGWDQCNMCKYVTVSYITRITSDVTYGKCVEAC